ncbi:MAG: hypothetical protein HY015_09495 [Bacteroidetes bacterium]|nr:hypothetical protein [Bacteroidota bacterium]MBI3483189.1 hypothetical protein [Bacteroidota bacterium]
MKTIISILSCVLFCTLVSARGTEGSAATPSVAVTNATGSTLFKVYYKSSKSGNITITIRNETGENIFSEVIRKTDAFIRPYNFEGLPEGQYTVTVENSDSKTVEKVNYKNYKVEKLIHIAKVSNEADKYLLTISSPRQEDVYIYFFDASGVLVYNEIQTIHKEFAQIYNLKEIKSFSVEVWDKDGVLRKYVSF